MGDPITTLSRVSLPPASPPWSVPCLAAGGAYHPLAVSRHLPCSMPCPRPSWAAGEKSGHFILTPEPCHPLHPQPPFSHSIHRPRLGAHGPSSRECPCSCSFATPTCHFGVFSEVQSHRKPFLVFLFGAPSGPRTSCFARREFPGS